MESGAHSTFVVISTVSGCGMGGITVDFLDVRNITRDDGLSVSRETFGGADDLETTWNIARECDDLNLRGYDDSIYGG